MGPENVHWAQPRSGQSKPIERAFRDLASSLDKDHRLRGAYTGSDPTRKPSNYDGKKAVPLADFLKVAEAAIAEHNARQGRRGGVCEGRSFNEVWEAGLAEHGSKIARLSTAQLERWLLAAQNMTASKKTGEVTVHGGRYWNEELLRRLAGRSEAERTVVVRYDPDHLDRPVVVEDREGRLIAHAEPLGKTPFLSTRAARETARDRGRLRKLARRQGEIQNRMDGRELDGMLDEVATEEPDSEPIERRKVVSAAFGLRVAARPEAAATGTDNVVELLPAGGRPVNEAEDAALPEEEPEDNFEVDYL